MSNRLNVSWWWSFVFLLGLPLLLTACGQSDSAADGAGAIAGNSGLVTQAEAAELDADMDDFETVMAVLSHPRCSNCHPAGDRPFQRDEQIPHLFNVTRGEDNHGGPVQKCATCHHEENNPYSNVPGAPHWGLAPRSMAWNGLSHAEIAEALLDPNTNGGRSHEDLIHHMNEDALVLWAWDPGEGRTPPPVPHDEFIEALTNWLEAGAPIPTE